MGKFYIIISIVLVSSCSDSNINNKNSLKLIRVLDTVELDILDNTDRNNNNLENIKFTRLELSNQSLINEFDLYKFYQNKYYVLSKKENKIVCFDFDGDFLFEINRQGKGKGEYSKIQYFEFQRDKNSLFILDLVGEKIISYNPSNGKYINDEPYINKIMSIYRIGNWEYLYAGYARHQFDRPLYNLMFYDRKKPSNTQQNHFEYTNYTDVIESVDPLKFYFDNILIYNEKYTNFIYHIRDSSFFPRYYIDFETGNIPTDFERDGKDPMKIYSEILENSWAYINNVVESSNYLYFLYKYNGDSRHIFYNKKDSKVFSFDTLSANNIKLYDAYIAGSNQNSFWGVVSPMQLLKDNPDHHAVQTLNLNENSNPVIFRISMK